MDEHPNYCPVCGEYCEDDEVECSTCIRTEENDLRDENPALEHIG